MTVNRELLTFAAKAAGIKGGYLKENRIIREFCYEQYEYIYIRENNHKWNPLTNDGDAFRLAVDMGLLIEINKRMLGDTFVSSERYDLIEIHNDNPHAATRLAIVRAAAQIGKDMK